MHDGNEPFTYNPRAIPKMHSFVLQPHYPQSSTIRDSITAYALFFAKADVLVNSARSNLNNPTACGQALMVRGGQCYKEACRPHTNIRPGDVVVTESGTLLSKYVVHAVCRNLISFQEPQSAFQV